jgi:hypothetical protein
MHRHRHRLKGWHWDVRGQGDRAQVCESESSSAPSPEIEATPYHNSQTQARPFLQAVGQQELGKRGCFILYDFLAMTQRRGRQAVGFCCNTVYVLVVDS